MPDLASAAAAGAAAGLAIAMPVGPIAVLLVDLGVRRGARAALAAGLGVALADGVYAGAAVLVGGALAELLEPVADLLRVASAAVLAAVGAALLARALRRPAADASTAPVVEPAVAPGHGRTTLRFLALTVVNPPTALYFASLVLGLPAVAQGDAASRTAFALSAFLASLAWQSAVALAGAGLGHALPRGAQRVTSALGGVVILGLALRVALG